MLKKLTVVDVLEEMEPVFESLIDDLSALAPFRGKAYLVSQAILLYQLQRRVRWTYGVAGLETDSELRMSDPSNDIPF